MNKPGFLILSLTVYAAILTMLVASMARLALIIFPTMHLMMNWSVYTTFYTAQSFVHQQLSYAPRDATLCIRSEQNEITWVAGDRIKSIKEKGGNLWYTEGDHTEGGGRAMQSSLLVRDCVFNVECGADNLIACVAYLKKDPRLRWECRQVRYG